MMFLALPADLKNKLAALQVLFPEGKVHIQAMGSFDDTKGECVFGPVKVIGVNRVYFTFEADGDTYTARIDSVKSGFRLTLED